MDWHSRFQQQARWTQPLREYFFTRIQVEKMDRILEIGCGTGAALPSIQKQDAVSSSPRIWGLDIDAGFLRQASRNAASLHLVQADAHAVPFPDQCFDLVFCHFLLLWVSSPSKVLSEARRITRPNGWVAAFAEPDYGGRVDFPVELEEIGILQEQSLKKQGADTRLGRRLAALFQQAGFRDVESGVIGAQWAQPASREELQLEWEVLISDLKQVLSPTDFAHFSKASAEAWFSDQRTLFVPTFYSFGRV